jgi:hypothetical protein
MRHTLLFASVTLLACSGGRAGGSAQPDAGDDTAVGGEAGSDAAAACGASSVNGIGVGAYANSFNPLDPLGYPPYALDGCTLVYLAEPAQGQAWGELRVRDLSSGVESTIAPASEQPRRPAVAGELVAWEAVVAGKSIVRTRLDGTTGTITGSFDHAGEPRVTNGAVAFTVWLGPDDTSDTDVYLYLPASGQLVPIATGWGQQRFSDVSSTLVAVSDFSEDPTGTFSATAHRNADIVVIDRSTLAKTVRHLPGKQAFPLLGSTTRLAYLDWGAVTPEPKFSEYNVMIGEVSANPTGDSNIKGSGMVQSNTPWVRPSNNGDFVVWVDESSGSGGLFGRSMDLSQPATSTLAGLQLVEPSAGAALSVVATPGTAGGYALRGVPR